MKSSLFAVGLAVAVASTADVNAATLLEDRSAFITAKAPQASIDFGPLHLDGTSQTHVQTAQPLPRGAGHEVSDVVMAAPAPRLGSSSGLPIPPTFLLFASAGLGVAALRKLKTPGPI